MLDSPLIAIHSSNDPPDHKSYIPSTNMGPPHLPMSADPQASFGRSMTSVPSPFQQRTEYSTFVPFQHHPPPPPPPPSQPVASSAPRKRRRSDPEEPPRMSMPAQPSSSAFSDHQRLYGQGSGPPVDLSTTPPAQRKKSRTNTPWTPVEEQRLKTMRDQGNSWSEIAKVRWLGPSPHLKLT